ncbi:hypothetical protein NFI96_018353, partial [Prochilodus magdalenae]
MWVVANNWTDVVMVKEGTLVTLPCSDGPAKLTERVTWMVMRSDQTRWTSLLSFNTSTGPAGKLLSSTSSRTFEVFEDVSLQFTATATDGGRYSCLMQQRGGKLNERIILLALLKLTLAPAPSIPVGSTVRLTAQVSPSYAVAGGMWLSPTGVPLLTVVTAPGTLLTKLPQVRLEDKGLYTCNIHIHSQNGKAEYSHTLAVTVNATKVATFPNITYTCGVNVRDGEERDTDDLLSCPHYPLQGLAIRCGAVPKPGSDAAAQDALDGSSVEGGEDGRWEMCLPQPSQEVGTLLGFLGYGAGVEGPGPTGSRASLSHLAVTLPCPPVYGDFVRLYKWRPNQHNSKPDPELVFQFDRWRNHTNKTKSHLQLLGPSSSEAGGTYSFLVRPALVDAGRYQCEVFLDDVVSCQSTTLTVLHGSTKSSPSSLNLTCMYTERSQVKLATWTHLERPDCQLPMKAKLGMLTISVSLPVTSETAGQYACTLELKNKQKLRYTYTVTLPPAVSVLYVQGGRVSEPSALSPLLSLLFFLVPVVAVAVGVLLWRQGRCSSRRNVDVEHTLSHCSGEVENIYENPEDLRQ